MQVGGLARFFSYIYTVKELKNAILFAESEGLPVFVLGEGSNVVIGDEGFPGVVLVLKNKGIHFEDRRNGDVSLSVSAGEHWDTVVGAVVEKKISGIENLSLIPGTVGAAPIQNIGAYGVELSDVIEYVTFFDKVTKKIITLNKAECEFKYRNSIFKNTLKDKAIILEVKFLLNSKNKVNISYKDLEFYFEEYKNPSVEEVRDAVIHIRTHKLPNVHTYGNVGSFFKNPYVSKIELHVLKKLYPKLPSYQAEDGKIKIPLAYFLDRVLGLRGYREGQVGLHEKQPLVIVNYGNATAKDIKNFSKYIKRMVHEKTGIQIEYEISFVGTF